MIHGFLHGITFRPGDHLFSSFVSKITNTAIDRYRKKKSRRNRVDSHMEDIAGEVEKIGNAISSDIEDYLNL